MNIGALRRCALFQEREFARLVRDQKLAREELLEWLGWENAGVFWTLKRAGLLSEVENRIEWSPDVLSPDVLSPDGETLLFGNLWICLDTGEVRQF